MIGAVQYQLKFERARQRLLKLSKLCGREGKPFRYVCVRDLVPHRKMAIYRFDSLGPGPGAGQTRTIPLSLPLPLPLPLLPLAVS